MRQMDDQTHDDSIYHTSIALRSKMGFLDATGNSITVDTFE